MARSSSPIELSSYTLLTKFGKCLVCFPSKDRDSIGDKIITYIVDMIDSIITARESDEFRESSIRNVRSCLNKIEVLLKYSKDRMFLSRRGFKDNEKVYYELCGIVNDIAKQQYNWYRSLNNKHSSETDVNPYTK